MLSTKPVISCYGEVYKREASTSSSVGNREACALGSSQAVSKVSNGERKCHSGLGRQLGCCSASVREWGPKVGSLAPTYGKGSSEMHLLIQHQEAESHVRTVTEDDLRPPHSCSCVGTYMCICTHMNIRILCCAYIHTQCQHVKFSRMIQTPLFWHASVLGPFVSF